MSVNKTFHILNLGAGVQSTTLYLMALKGSIQIDCAIFSDTQEEPSEVYKHLAWLESLGGPKIHKVTAGKLGDDLINGKNSTGHRFVSIPAFTTTPNGEKAGLLRRQCTSEYKILPIQKCIRSTILGLKPRGRVPKSVLVYQYIGMSLDEVGRAMRVRDNFSRNTPWSTPVFPLIDFKMTRDDCKNWLRDYGVPHETPRSACGLCPYHSNKEWRRIRDNDPEAWARAVTIDSALRKEGTICNRGMLGKLYLHRSLVPLDQADISIDRDKIDNQLNLGFWKECQGMCGV